MSDDEHDDGVPIALELKRQGEWITQEATLYRSGIVITADGTRLYLPHLLQELELNSD